MSNQNQLATPQQKTMSSIELVKIINDLREDGQAILRHTTFTEKVRKVLGDKAAEFSAPLKTESGQTAQGYLLPKREAELMVMSESYKVQAAVYDRMVELEAQQQVINPAKLTRLQLIQLAMEAETELQAEKEKNALLEPKAQALDRIEGCDGASCITNTAKVLKVQPKFLFKFLSEQHWIYKRTGSHTWLGYQEKIQSGYLEHKTTTVSRSDGSEKVVEQVLVTAKGLVKLSKLLNASLKIVA